MNEIKTVSPEYLFELFESCKKCLYTKKGRYIFRVIEAPEETVLTIVAGKLETIKTAVQGDVVIRNIIIGGSAETYIISADKFESRYEMLNKLHYIDGLTWQEAQAKGQIEAFQYLHPDPIQFKAPWGEDMICYCEDYIAHPIPGDPHDIYRIEIETFNQTYSKKR